MTTSTSKTASKTVKTVKTLATFVAEWNKINDTFETKIRKAESDKVDAQSKLVAEMSIVGGHKQNVIAKALGITEDYAGKLIARGVAVIVGLDGTQTAEMIKATGNKVTVSAIKKISAPNRKKSEIKADLMALGLEEKSTAKRPNAVGKGKTAPIVKVRTTLDTWVKQAKAGKIDRYELGAMLDMAITALDDSAE